MKKLTSLIGLILLTGISNMYASDIRAEFGFARFSSPKEGAYLETYLLLKGHSLEVVKDETGKFYSEVAIILKLKKGNVVAFQDAYRVKGPLMDAEQVIDFMDQQRIPLQDGAYDIELAIHDVNRPEGLPALVQQQLVINHRGRVVNISDVELVRSFDKTVTTNMLSKAGFDLVPFTSNFFPQTIDDLNFYFEVYNTDNKIKDDEEFLLNIFIENADDGSLAGDLRKYFKRRGEEVIPVLHSFPLKHISSGNYNIVIEVRDKKNEALDTKRFFFQRSNTVEAALVSSEEYKEGEDGFSDLSNTFVAKYNRPEELKHHVKCLIPIATQQEVSQITKRINYNDAAMMKRYLYNFWKSRYPDTAEAEWNKYQEQVKKVNASYGNNMNMGYETERGRVYLQYGPPNTIADSYFEPNTYPYEIWHYYKLENRNLNASDSNKRFVFANTSPGSNEFILLHSDADNEQNNARWHFDLQKRNEPNTDLDEEQGRSHNGSRALQYYNNPR